MNRRQRAIVIGGSLGGLFAANMLNARGWHVDVYERVSDDLATPGYTFNGEVRWVEIDHDTDAEENDYLIMAEERLQVARSHQKQRRT